MSNFNRCNRLTFSCPHLRKKLRSDRGSVNEVSWPPRAFPAPPFHKDDRHLRSFSVSLTHHTWLSENLSCSQSRNPFFQPQPLLSFTTARHEHLSTSSTSPRTQYAPPRWQISENATSAWESSTWRVRTSTQSTSTVAGHVASAST